MRRRAFIAGLGGATVLPFVLPPGARAQPAMPVIGFLHSQSADIRLDFMQAFRQGLRDNGYVEGENVTIVYRWADNRNDRLPELASELVSRRVAVIAVTGTTASVAAAKATATIPIAFAVPEDPVGLGLVTSLSRPGGNATGVNFFAVELAAKRLELLRELVPSAARVGVLIDSAEPAIAVPNLRDVETAARAIGVQIHILRASSALEIDAAFAALVRERLDALFVSSGPFFTSRRVQLAHLATRHSVPAIHGSRLYTEVGGLISYGTNVAHAYRQVGDYVGRILKGAKPADLPVLQATKFELAINAQTARMLGLTVPAGLLARADEVIE